MTLPSLDLLDVPVGVEPVTVDTEHIQAIADSTTTGSYLMVMSLAMPKWLIRIDILLC